MERTSARARGVRRTRRRGWRNESANCCAARGKAKRTHAPARPRGSPNRRASPRGRSQGPWPRFSSDLRVIGRTMYSVSASGHASGGCRWFRCVCVCVCVHRLASTDRDRSRAHNAHPLTDAFPLLAHLALVLLDERAEHGVVRTARTRRGVKPLGRGWKSRGTLPSLLSFQGGWKSRSNRTLSLWPGAAGGGGKNRTGRREGKRRV